MATLLIDWFRRPEAFRIVEDVPADVAACEFDCRKVQCRHDEWATCANRIRNQAVATEILSPQ